jgi:hypothetical protein
MTKKTTPTGLPGAFETHTGDELAKLAESLWKAQQKVKIAKTKVDALKESADALEAELQHAMIAAKLESVASKHATCSLKRTEIATITDDRAFFAFASKKANWDLLYKRANNAACKARWEDDVVVPGVEKATRVDLSVTSRSVK